MKDSYSLKEIASWTNDHSEVIIPALQRGLVWKPSQVELLWDSILRGFPVGSFMLSDIVSDKPTDKPNGKYYLMDGQQRFNAISLGYNTNKAGNAVLWIDLDPPTTAQSTRKYWIKATTTSHPWGYNNDDECSRLNTAEKREALSLFGLDGNIFNREFSLMDTWPAKSKKPIPLFCLLEADTTNEEVFCQSAIDMFKSSGFSDTIKTTDFSKVKPYIQKFLYPAFKSITEYSINCNHLPKEVMESETMNENNDQTSLEVLFTRLNVGGTTISKDDLNYSAIKAYWPSIKDVNDALSKKYMSPSKLAMLAFRLALTNEEEKSLKNELSIKQIRSAAKEADKREKIYMLYQHLGNILEIIDKWLGVEENSDLKTPSLLRTSIARNSPDIYLLLMYFAYKQLRSQSPLDLQPHEIKSLAFYLHWFATNKKECAKEIYLRCKEGINLLNVQKGLSHMMHNHCLLFTYSPKEVYKFIQIEESEKWRIGNSLPAHAYEFFNRVFWYSNTETKEMLLYVQRQYINTHFSQYDPARQDMWAEYNRPWDFDHIIPQEWIVGRRNADYRDFDKDWLNSIGNMAAISFEANRSKSNASEWSEYRQNAAALLYDCRVEQLDSEIITKDKDQSIEFANITLERFNNIYAAVYNLIESIVSRPILSDTLQKRKDLFYQIQKHLPNAGFYFVASDNRDHLIERDLDWAREWVGVGSIINGYYVCYEWDARKRDDINIDLEIGIRKMPGESLIPDEKRDAISSLELSEYERLSNNDWWYYFKDAKALDGVESIVEEMSVLIEKLGKALI